MTKEMLLDLLNGISIPEDEEGRVIAHRIEDMKEEDVKSAIIDFIYGE